MKKITTTFFLMLFALGFSQQQDYNVTFESGSTIGDWTSFENGTGAGFELVANPDLTGNTSATVAKFSAAQNGQPWAGCQSGHGGFGSWKLSDPASTTLTIMVYKSVISDVGVKFVTSTNGTTFQLLKPNTKINEWETMTFDISGSVNSGDFNNIDRIVVFPDFTARTQDNVCYFDNIQFSAYKLSDPVVFVPPTEPSVAAPTPPARIATDVVSVYGSSYANVSGVNLNPGWGQSTAVSEVSIAGNSTLKYANFNYQGTELAASNASDMEYMHIDIWTSDATNVKVSPINNGTGAGEYLVNVPLVASGWSSVDLPKSAFVGMNWDSIYQLKFDGQAGVTPSTIYLDNIYFWKTSTVIIPTGPTVAAPTPPARVASDVISVYSSAYTNVSGVNLNPNWGQSTAVSEVSIVGDSTIKYANFNYQGTELATSNASAMEYMHIDIWTSDATNVKVSPINNGTGVGEHLVNIPLVANGWSSIDLPKSAFVGMTWDSVYQLKFDGQAGVNPSTIYLDNLYFWREALPAGTPTITFTIPAKTLGDAPFSLSSLITSNSAGAITFSSSNQNVATISGSTVTIVGAGTTTITADQAADGIYNAASKTADLVVADAPMVAAPTPPNRASGDVISLFSNAYSNIAIDTWSATWDDSSYQDIQIAGNDTKKIAFNNFIGVDFSGAGNHIDASSMTNFHMDFWTANADLVGKVFNSKFSQWGGGVGEVSALELNINAGTSPAIVTGSWVSIDVPISQFVNNLTRNDIAQFIITSNLGIVYVDNIYLYKGLPLATEKFATSAVKMYPNPATNNLTIEANNIIEKVALFNVLGQEVVSKITNNQVVSLDISSLQNGVYIVKTTINGVTSASRIIKN